MHSRPHSIRWRLPLTYAGIALLAALVLGAVLLTILRGYYAEREQAYLEERAQLLGTALAPALEQKLDVELVQQQVMGMAFLAQARVQLQDVNEQIVADSGPPRPNALFNLPLAPSATTSATTGVNQVRLLINSQPFTQTAERMRIDLEISRTTTLTAAPGSVAIRRTLDDQDLLFLAPAPDFFMARDLSDDPEVSGLRSTHWVQVPLHDAQGQLLGYLQLSEGPAYGRQIVSSAAQGLLVAGLTAVGLAGLVGLWISRQISRPLAELTAVTAQMAAGDLSARAAVASQDELGVLGHSFNEMAQRVDDTVAALRRFVADAAHELNTPLTALRTNLELGEPSSLTTQQIAQVVRLEGLVKNLLLLSRLEAPANEHQPLDLGQLLCELGEPFASRAEQREINFTLETPATPVMINGERGLLIQALTNLLDNALKFSRAGDTISVRLYAETGAAHLSVEDTGIGIPTADVPLLFQRFYRASNAAAYPGNGLGLAIVKAIVEQHGGSVRAEPQKQGLRIVLALPLENR